MGMHIIILVLANTDETRYRRNLRDVLNENKEMISRPAITLVPSIFSLFPLTLIGISLSLGCQNLENNPLRYLLITFYFLNFIPSVFTFVLYIYPSSFYWKRWQATTIHKQLTGRRRDYSPKLSKIFSTAKDHRTLDFSQVKSG
jgi:hypothetical protein